MKHAFTIIVAMVTIILLLVLDKHIAEGPALRTLVWLAIVVHGVIGYEAVRKFAVE